MRLEPGPAINSGAVVVHETSRTRHGPSERGGGQGLQDTDSFRVTQGLRGCRNPGLSTDRREDSGPRGADLCSSCAHAGLRSEVTSMLLKEMWAQPKRLASARRLRVSSAVSKVRPQSSWDGGPADPPTQPRPHFPEPVSMGRWRLSLCPHNSTGPCGRGSTCLC